MKLIRLRIENDAMDIAYHPVSGKPQRPIT